MTKPDGMTIVIDQDGERMIFNFPDIDRIEIQNQFDEPTFDGFAIRAAKTGRVGISFNSGEYTFKKEAIV